jgi:hypothetical protein
VMPQPIAPADAIAGGTVELTAEASAAAQAEAVGTPMPAPASDPEVTRSRRSVIAAALGGVAGLVGHRLVNADPVAAANGDSLILGQSNSASTYTVLNSTSPQGLIVYGASSGVEGRSSGSTGVGVFAAAHSGGAGRNYGVYAQAHGTDGAGVWAFSGNNSTGVIGFSYPQGSFGNNPTNPKKTGVYGVALQDAEAMGVMGESAAGVGVKGKATTGSGVYGTTQSGFGVFGYSASGTAARFQTSAALTGVALQTIGRVKFDKSVGRATIAAGTKSIVVTPGIDLTTTSAAVATLQGSANGALVERVAIDTTANTLTIYLTKNTTVAVSVAWHVFG